MFLAKMSKKERVGIIIALSVAIAAIVDRVVIGPINGKIRQIDNEIKMSEKQLGVGLRNLNQKDAVNSQYAKYSKYLKKAGSEEESTAAILGEIEGLARKSGLNIADLKPQGSKDKGFYRAYSVEMEAEGTIESLTNFIYHLNASAQLLRAEKLRLSLKDKEAGLIKASFLISKISLS